MNLEELKAQLQTTLGIVDHHLSDDELRKVVKKIKSINPEERSEANLQKVITSITGVNRFLIKEGFDNSDIDNIIDQIEDLLDVCDESDNSHIDNLIDQISDELKKF
jgi:hypothetical protein